MQFIIFLQHKYRIMSLTRNEKIKVSIHEDASLASLKVARRISDLIREKESVGQKTVLGLATGSSPTKVYEYLVRFHKEEGLSFKNVYTFNLDEYYPIHPESLQSYVRFMNEHLFDHIDIPDSHIHIPDGKLAEGKIDDYCTEYEAKIIALGGIDLQLLGIGRTGHVGFNEPGSTEDSKTRLIILDKVTRLDAASDFFGIEHVPERAITMGVGTILDSKEVIILAWGEGKSPIVQRAVEGNITENIPATYLQKHNNCTFYVDPAAANDLTRIKTPWLVGECNWNENLIKKATIWLSSHLNKAILKLTNEDYNEHGMGRLLAENGSAEEVNVKIFNILQHTITGWPGGKPHVDDSTRPERASPFHKRVVIFSPHPDDDVISMGGTFLRLVDQGHEVHVAYQTSGNIAVFDDEVLRFLDFTRSVINDDETQTRLDDAIQQTRSFINNKNAGDVDTAEIQKYKGMIRRGEALAACRYCGITEEYAHFLDMPFYETGRIKKNPISDLDVKVIYDLLQEIKPHQIFAAGDLSDPHGTHRVCLQGIFRAIDQLKEEKTSWLDDTYVWLYRGAWQEWGIGDIEMAVPIGPKDLTRKRNAIYKHQSQKDRAMFPGNDSREFWQRAEDRNRATAEAYDKLGLAEYEAIEAFVRYKF